MAFVRKNCNNLAARHVDTQAELDVTAGELLSVMRAVAARHVESGAYLASLQVWRGKIDRHVGSDDPGAMAIEWGRDPNPAKGIGAMEGQHILRRSMDMI